MCECVYTSKRSGLIFLPAWHSGSYFVMHFFHRYTTGKLMDISEGKKILFASVKWLMVFWSRVLFLCISQKRGVRAVFCVETDLCLPFNWNSIYTLHSIYYARRRQGSLSIFRALSRGIFRRPITFKLKYLHHCLLERANITS